MRLPGDNLYMTARAARAKGQMALAYQGHPQGAINHVCKVNNAKELIVNRKTNAAGDEMHYEEGHS